MKKGVNRMTQYVVIGNGVAAVGCIEGIRKMDATGKILVISEKNHPVYCRPLISYCLEGKTTPEKWHTLKRLFTKDDYLTGFILIGATDRAGIYTSLIRDRIPLSSINFERLKKTATSTAFSAEKRKQFFGGVV